MLPPASVERLRDLIGKEGTERLIAACAGRRIYIPHTANARLIEMVGLESAAKLSAEFAGDRIEVPICSKPGKRVGDPALATARNRAIVQALLDGLNNTEISRRYCLSRRQVKRLRSSRLG